MRRRMSCPGSTQTTWSVGDLNEEEVDLPAVVDFAVVRVSEHPDDPQRGLSLGWKVA